MATATEAALAFVEGHAVSASIDALGEEIFDELMAASSGRAPSPSPSGTSTAGQRVWLVTAAPVELATIIAQRLGLTGALGTVTEIEDGVYTGRLVGAPLHGQAKAEAVARAGRARGPRPAPLRRVLRLRQRHADAVAGRPPVRGQPRRQAARARPGHRLAGARLPPPAATAGGIPVAVAAIAGAGVGAGLGSRGGSRPSRDQLTRRAPPYRRPGFTGVCTYAQGSPASAREFGPGCGVSSCRRGERPGNVRTPVKEGARGRQKKTQRRCMSSA